MPILMAIPLYLIEILHQTTTYGRQRVPQKCCILSKFYIKPQRVAGKGYPQAVVSYRNSTSNHNWQRVLVDDTELYLIEILHQTTTCCFVHITPSSLYLIEILHQTTTCGKCEDCLRRCILSKFYIKPQQWFEYRYLSSCCILSKFYIKPQQSERKTRSASGCILSKFYIKPQRHDGTNHFEIRCILSKFYIKPQH